MVCRHSEAHLSNNPIVWGNDGSRHKNAKNANVFSCPSFWIVHLFGVSLSFCSRPFPLLSEFIPYAVFSIEIYFLLLSYRLVVIHSNGNCAQWLSQKAESWRQIEVVLDLQYQVIQIVCYILIKSAGTNATLATCTTIHMQRWTNRRGECTHTKPD